MFTLTKKVRNHYGFSELSAVVKSSQIPYAGLGSVITAIASGAKQINNEVRKAALGGTLGATNAVNVHGEIVQRLDKLASEVFVEVLSNSGCIAAITSEELEKPVMLKDDKYNKYVVFMDPLDGSSNIDVSVSIGSIFGIWPRNPDNTSNESALLQSGNKQVAAVYVVYGSSTVLVVATKNNVQGFTLDPSEDEFYLTHPDIKTPPLCQYYSVNEGNFNILEESIQKVIEWLRDTYSLRYVGSLVADFHRNLLKGGIFLYPGDKKNPTGKLRLMYECNPLGFIVEQSGGAAYSVNKPILDIQPEGLHQRSPVILGDKHTVGKVMAKIKKARKQFQGR